MQQLYLSILTVQNYTVRLKLQNSFENIRQVNIGGKSCFIPVSDFVQVYPSASVPRGPRGVSVTGFHCQILKGLDTPTENQMPRRTAMCWTACLCTDPKNNHKNMFRSWHKYHFTEIHTAVSFQIQLSSQSVSECVFIYTFFREKNNNNNNVLFYS